MARSTTFVIRPGVTATVGSHTIETVTEPVSVSVAIDKDKYDERLKICREECDYYNFTAGYCPLLVLKSGCSSCIKPWLSALETGKGLPKEGCENVTRGLGTSD